MIIDLQFCTKVSIIAELEIYKKKNNSHTNIVSLTNETIYKRNT